MNVSEYDYDFPQEAIAITPPAERGTSQLFVVDTGKGTITQALYHDLDQFLLPSDTLVRNITKVFHARLFGIPITKTDEKLADIEVFFTEPHAQSLDEYVARQWNEQYQGFELTFLCTLRQNQLDHLSSIDLSDGYQLVHIKKEQDAFSGILRRLDQKITVHDVFSLFETKGKVPLPPYIKRQTNNADEERYQTIFAKKTGSVAAPTASLNFTKELETRLAKKGISIAEVILHVGRGTFQPLRSEIVEENVLHTEPFYIPAETAQTVYTTKQEKTRIIAMGTTVTRTLEANATALLSGTTTDLFGETNLFIYPPYRFSIIDGLLTNFHFPKSSLITLVDAFLQWKKSPMSWREIYHYAIDHNAKLFSYGDSMLIL